MRRTIMAVLVALAVPTLALAGETSAPATKSVAEAARAGTSATVKGKAVQVENQKHGRSGAGKKVSAKRSAKPAAPATNTVTK